jgi:hypothetical protein
MGWDGGGNGSDRRHSFETTFPLSLWFDESGPLGTHRAGRLAQEFDTPFLVFHFGRSAVLVFSVVFL